MTYFSRVLLSIAVALAVFSTTSQAQVTGAGATFPAPIYNKWADAYNKATGVQVNYAAIGSGGGIKQINSKTVQFGASDEAVKQAELDKMGQIMFPTVMGGVVAVINVPGVKTNELNLTSKQLADIYDNKITNWRQVNPKLPDLVITRVSRADSSGTTSVFTHYLARHGFATAPGKTVSWAGTTNIQGKGNAGVAAMVKQVSGSIGYVEYAYTKSNSLVTTKLDGVEASFDNFKAGKYKLTAETYIIVYPDASAKGAIKFFDWAFTNGDAMAKDLDYVPLSDSKKAQIRASWKKLGY